MHWDPCGSEGGGGLFSGDHGPIIFCADDTGSINSGDICICSSCSGVAQSRGTWKYQKLSFCFQEGTISEMSEGMGSHQGCHLTRFIWNLVETVFLFSKVLVIQQILERCGQGYQGLSTPQGNLNFDLWRNKDSSPVLCGCQVSCGCKLLNVVFEHLLAPLPESSLLLPSAVYTTNPEVVRQRDFWCEGSSCRFFQQCRAIAASKLPKAWLILFGLLYLIVSMFCGCVAVVALRRARALIVTHKHTHTHVARMSSFGIPRHLWMVPRALPSLASIGKLVFCHTGAQILNANASNFAFCILQPRSRENSLATYIFGGIIRSREETASVPIYTTTAELSRCWEAFTLMLGNVTKLGTPGSDNESSLDGGRITPITDTVHVKLVVYWQKDRGFVKGIVHDYAQPLGFGSSTCMSDGYALRRTTLFTWSSGKAGCRIICRLVIGIWTMTSEKLEHVSLSCKPMHLQVQPEE